jgi:hypothetical protein
MLGTLNPMLFIRGREETQNRCSFEHSSKPMVEN